MNIKGLFLILIFSSLGVITSAQASESGLYHDFYIGKSCPDQAIYSEIKGQNNNYKDFIQNLVSRLDRGEDSCTMSMVLNLQSFIRYLILNNHKEAYADFFTELNFQYLAQRKNETQSSQKCRLHSNETAEKVEDCKSDHIVDISVLANRVWFNYFFEDIRKEKRWNKAIKATMVAGSGVGIMAFIFRTHIKKMGIRFAKKSFDYLFRIIRRNSSRLLRTGVGGTAGASINFKLTKSEALVLKAEIENFGPPLNYISFPEEDGYTDDFGLNGEETLLASFLDFGVVFGAGILPVLAAEYAILKMATVVPSLSSTLGARMAHQATAFLRSPLAKIAAGVVATITLGHFLMKEWSRSQLMEQIAELNGAIEALKEEIKEGDPRSLSVYLMTQELVSLTESLSLIYASPVVAKLESTYHRYSTEAICTPIISAIHGVDFSQDYAQRSLGKIDQVANKTFEDNKDSFDLAFTTLNSTLNFINNEITLPKTGRSLVEYQGLKLRLYDVAEYLIKFKSPTIYRQKLNTAMLTNMSKTKDHAQALVGFYHAAQKASPPYFTEIPINVWNKKLAAIDFYQSIKEGSEESGYDFSCVYDQFPALFTDFHFIFQHKVPCESQGADQYKTCISCDDRSRQRSCRKKYLRD